MTHKNPAARLARWFVRLEQYSFKIEYRKGSAHGNADALSRWPLKDSDEDGESEFTDIHVNEVIIVRKDHTVRARIVKSSEHMLVQVQAIFFKQVRGAELQQDDKEIQWMIRAVKRGLERLKRPDNLSKDQLIYFREWDNLVIDGDTCLLYTSPSPRDS